ncbi:DUF6928 family protein [Streptomyces sp. NPDC059785]|uniref:DUF6928 family protein n=1 Tax=Streptomyces sp. NPDC059785 TaxID=3346945 RepID=UPI00365F7A02
MGAKSAVPACADGAVGGLLADAAEADRERTAALVGRTRPGRRCEEDGEEPWFLADAVHPPEGTVCALSVPGLDLVCDRDVMIGRPSRLPAHLVAAGRGRRLCLHAMHSGGDRPAFALWEDGRLVRSLSLSPDEGVIEDIGDRLPFERAYWDGRHPVRPDAPDAEPYALPFHPLDLKERALLEFFGFHLEGCAGGEDVPEPVVDVFGTRLRGYRISG